MLLVWEWARAVDLAGLVAAKREQLFKVLTNRRCTRKPVAIDAAIPGALRLANAGAVAISNTPSDFTWARHRRAEISTQHV